MKRINFTFLAIVCFLAGGVVFTGCYKDVIGPEIDPDGPPQAVSFSLDLAPLFDKSCALSGCHSGGTKKPELSLGNAYRALVSGGYVNTTVPKSSLLYISINSEMSEYMPSPKDKAKVYDWIRNGAPNN